MENGLIQKLETLGYQASVVSIRRLDDLQEAIDGAYKQGFLDEAFYQERLTRFVFSSPDNLPEATSLIVVAYRDPPVSFSFDWKGERFSLVVPPTYLHWQAKDRRVDGLLAELLEPHGYRVAPATVPKKLLAVCSGLAEYGKNNVTYVGGMGSFYRLATFCSDLPREQDEWRDPKAMERCERCSRCVRSCPTGAIDPERFLLRAERCLTFLNEKPGHVAFPEWVDRAGHNCLVGCMHCQRSCPENRAVLDWYEEGVAFSEQETELLIGEVLSAKLPAPLVKKLGRWDLLELLDVMPRNLAALLDRKEPRSSWMEEAA
jgi:epoxyqueuosine reductase